MIIHVVVVYTHHSIESGKEWSLLTSTLSKVSFLSCPKVNKQVNKLINKQTNKQTTNQSP